MPEKKPLKLNFTTSSKIKSIVGKDLITDRFVAVFELVKNAYDAKASKTLVSFDFESDTFESCIRINDNGIGMSKEDLISKWLYLAYSDKQEGQVNTGIDDGHNIQNRVMVGSKGIGRFSCDSLGSLLTIRTKKKGETHENILDVDWDKFDESNNRLFENVEVDYSSQQVELEQVSKSYTKLLTDVTHLASPEVP